MTSYWGFSDDYHWYFHTGPLDHDNFEQWVNETQAHLDAGSSPLAVLAVMHDAAPPQARERGRIAAMLNSPGARRHKARALVVSSATLRMVLRGIDWVAPPPFASGYFERASSALSWLGVQRPRLDLERLRAHLLRDVPPALAAASGLTRPLQLGAAHSVPG